MNEIHGFIGEYRFLSNYYPCRIFYNGFQFTSVEAAFQSEKCVEPREFEKFTELSASEARRMGRSVSLSKGWEERKVSVMRDLLHAKFLDNPDLLEKLLQTGDAQLIEKNHWHDNFWGSCTCSRCAERPHHNTLGQLLMELRDSVSGRQRPAGMLPAFRYMDIDVEPLRLFTKERILMFMYYNGAYGPTLDQIREQYERIFGVELVWRYPIMDNLEDGCVIIPVQEGFLRLPYDRHLDEKDDFEYYKCKDAELLDQKAIQTLFCDLTTYTAGLAAALSEIEVAMGGHPLLKDNQDLYLKFPNGQVIRAAKGGDVNYPALQIQLMDPLGERLPEIICFAEHNPNRPAEHQLCIGAYQDEIDDPTYYKSYVACNQDEEV